MLGSPPHPRRVRGGWRSVASLAVLAAAWPWLASATGSDAAAGPAVATSAASAPDKAHVHLPAAWAEGALLDGKPIARIERHREYIRVHVEGGGFELGRCRDPADPWCDGNLRVQPMPDQPADEAALTRRLDELRARPRIAMHEALDDAGAGAGADADGTGLWWWLQRLVATSGLSRLLPTLLALVGLWLGWLATREHPEARRGVWALALMTLAAPILGRTLLGPDSVATLRIAHLHESNASDTAALLVQAYAEDQPAWQLTSAVRGIHGIVAANRLLWVLGVLAIWVWVRSLLPSGRMAWLVVGLVAGNGFNAALRNSELETPEIWLAVCAGVAAFVVADDARLRAATRWGAAAYLPSLLLLVDRRRETLLLVIAALLSLAARQLRRRPDIAPRLDAAWQRGVAVALRPATLVLFGLLVVAQGLWARELAEACQPLGHALGDHVHVGGVSPSSWISLLPALSPTDVSFVFVLLNLATWSNLLLAILVAYGAIAIVRQRHDWIWLLVTVATVYKLYRAAGHAFPFEVVRYLATLAPFWAAIAALGVTWAWPRLQSATPTPGARRLALLAIALAAILDARYGALDANMGPWLGTRGPVGDQQTSFWAMAQAVETNPDCAVITRSTTETDAEGVVIAEELVVVGQPWATVTRVATEAELPRAVASLSPPPRCTLVLDGLDCRCAGSEGCASLGEGPILATSVPTMVAYRHDHWGRALDDVRPFTVRRLRQDLDPTRR